MGLGAAAGRLLAEVDWEREAYPAYDDFLALPAFVLFFPTVRFFLDRFVFEVTAFALVLHKEGVAWLVGLQPRAGFLKKLLVHTYVGMLAAVVEWPLKTRVVVFACNWQQAHTDTISRRIARRLILGKGHHRASNETEETRKKIRKFKESAWKCVYFLSGELLSLSVTYNEPWFTNTRYFWVGPGEQVWPDQKIKLKLKAVYMYAAGFYTYSIFALMFWETRRSDFGVSMSHHVATVVLIVLSYVFRFARVGSIVLAIHDASDVFLEVGKMSKYSHCDWLANISFLLFVVSWILLRLTYFPFWILRSTSYEVLLTLDKKKHSFDGPIYYYVFNSLLFSLLVLHIYWWVLIYRMLVRQIRTRNVGDDVRSDSEDEHED